MLWGLMTVLSSLQVVTPEWVLAWMQKLQPEALAPWRQSYAETAAAIADAANEDNLFPKRQDGATRTAALLIAIAYHESRFNPVAIGDSGAAFGLYQIHVGALSGVKLDTRELLLPRDASRVAIRLIRVSAGVCKPHPSEDMLTQYASGGPTCDSERGRHHSHVRMSLANRIMKEEP